MIKQNDFLRKVQNKKKPFGLQIWKNFESEKLGC